MATDTYLRFLCRPKLRLTTDIYIMLTWILGRTYNAQCPFEKGREKQKGEGVKALQWLVELIQ
jgi:hypothetical protein